VPKKRIALEVAGREVSISSPDKIYFPEAGFTKLDVVRYYEAVAEGALASARDRPIVLKRYVNGIGEEAFYQKRAPKTRPSWVRTATLKFPSGRTAEEIVLDDAAQLLWVVNLGCIELHTHPVRASDVEHPDELRMDLDPVPGIPWSQVLDVGQVVKSTLDDLGLVGWPKTSGSRGLHVNARIEPRWTFPEVRQAALAIAREVERRAPDIATSRWWKEERHGVFIDYNQNAKDRTTAAAFSVRPTADARVSMPLTWDELPSVDPAAFTLVTVPDLFRERGVLHAGMDDAAGSLDRALELAAEQAADGAVDAPWPPHHPKTADEPPRVQPSKRRRSSMPLIEIGRAKKKDDALAGLTRWKARHPEVVAYLEPADVLVDGMRGRHSLWYRVRVNLQHVPEAQRPPQEALDPDYDPRSEWGGGS
jgi:bifunctional non-homologous end joining protein LigD